MTAGERRPGTAVGTGELTEVAEPDPGAGGIPLRAGNLELDPARWTVHRDGIQVEVSPTEFRLLSYLMSNQGRVLSRERILKHVWGRDEAHQPQIVDTYISYLRRKLDPLGPPLIHTQRGAGYSLRPPRAVCADATPG